MKHRTGIGLDINDATICVVELRATAEGLQLVRSASAPTPPGSVLDGAIAQPKTVAKAVRRLLRSGRFSVAGKRVAVSLASSAAVIRVTQLSGSGPSAIKEHIQQEIKRYAFFGGDATINDFAVVTSAPGTKGHSQALLAAAREDTVHALVETVMKAGLELVLIDVSSLASARAVCSKLPEAFAAVALAVVEPGLIHAMVVQGGTVRFTHTAACPISIFDEAAGGASDLASKIRSVLDFYDAEMGNLKDVQKILVCASQNTPDGLAARISQALEGIAVELYSPSSIVQRTGLLSKAGDRRPTPCAVGLAMRAVGDSGFAVSLNLLPEAIVQAQRLRKRALLLATLAASLLLLALVGAGAIRLRLHALGRETIRGQMALASVVAPSSPRQTEAEIALISRELAERDAFLGSARAAATWSTLLSELSMRIPEDVRLTSLEADRSGGLSVTGECLSLASAHRFAALLTESDLIRSAKVTTVRAGAAGGEALPTYKLDCQLLARDDKGK
jgi:Tfp pilus assembly PilM family ATPase/Tfp pilus assembly protein PilN